jgi:general secretion pathway protein H
MTSDQRPATSDQKTVSSRLVRSTQHGFTLIELAVVIVVISMVAIIVLPLLPSTGAADLKNSARRLATVVRYLGERSVTTKTPYRMRLDLNEGTVVIKKIINGEEAPPEDPFFSRSILDDGVSIEDIEVQRVGKLGEGVVNVDFGVAGLGEFVVIHLKGGKEGRFTVTALPYGGRVDLLEGYQEITL